MEKKRAICTSQNVVFDLCELHGATCSHFNVPPRDVAGTQRQPGANCCPPGRYHLRVRWFSGLLSRSRYSRGCLANEIENSKWPPPTVDGRLLHLDPSWDYARLEHWFPDRPTDGCPLTAMVFEGLDSHMPRWSSSTIVYWSCRCQAMWR